MERAYHDAPREAGYIVVSFDLPVLIFTPTTSAASLPAPNAAKKT